MLKLLQEVRGFAAVSNRCPAPKFSSLLLMQMRATGPRDSLRQRKLSIAIDSQSGLCLPHPVRIHHVKQGPDFVRSVSVA